MIDSPVSRRARLANNVVFAIAFVVLLGTVFPLIMEALDDRRTVVGAPYFDRLSLPIGIALLFLMAVAPVLPWRKASQELLRDRLFWPAWCGALALAVAVAAGADGWAPARRVRPGRVRRRVSAAATGAGTRRQGWRGLMGARQRRHDRAPRRDRRRRRAGGVERLHEVGRDHAAAPASRSRGKGTRSSLVDITAEQTAPTSCAPTWCSTTARSTARRSRPT